ncbi:MAG: rhodanese-like domain-containing protein [Acetobacteraceae bacterium]|nr:rhodanese-like domain-containing protein [Acetobacteraceae bacterium]
MPNPVTAIEFAAPAQVAARVAMKLSLETDCADVHAALVSGDPGFVLIEARGPEAYARGHIPGAINLWHRDITAERLAAFPPETRFVAYCAGPHCNGADRAALALARLGRHVKVMPGGITGWLAEGHALVTGSAPGSLTVGR